MPYFTQHSPTSRKRWRFMTRFTNLFTLTNFPSNPPTARVRKVKNLWSSRTENDKILFSRACLSPWDVNYDFQTEILFRHSNPISSRSELRSSRWDLRVFYTQRRRPPSVCAPRDVIHSVIGVATKTISTRSTLCEILNIHRATLFIRPKPAVYRTWTESHPWQPEWVIEPHAPHGWKVERRTLQQQQHSKAEMRWRILRKSSHKHIFVPMISSLRSIKFNKNISFSPSARSLA